MTTASPSTSPAQHTAPDAPGQHPAPGEHSAPDAPDAASVRAARILVIVNDIESGPGRLSRTLVAEGIEFDVRIGSSGLPPLHEAAQYAGIVALGGGLMPDAVDRAPWLRDEARIVSSAVATGQPYLGICLGGQLLAHVGGGDVRAEFGAPEKGFTPISIQAHARRDPLFAGLSETPRFVESHVDRIVALPAGGVLLASSEACENQAFRLGEAAWGLQFHPEAGVENILRWDAQKLSALGFDKNELIARAHDAQPQADEDSRALLSGFCSVVRDHHGLSL